jgi:hypothetical protein
MRTVAWIDSGLQQVCVPLQGVRSSGLVVRSDGLIVGCNKFAFHCRVSADKG